MTNPAIALSNNPPPDADPLRERLAEDHAALLTRAEQLLDAYSRVPAEIDGDSMAAALAAALPHLLAADQTAASSDVLTERRRQIEVEGWTPEHDDKHGDGELARAAACYAISKPSVTWYWYAIEAPMLRGVVEHLWPWKLIWWKPRDQRRNLVKAGALILAEIERLDRVLPPPPLATDGEGR